ncbi:hypothetical protein M902_0655 [Bacteriovorax sp. BAL6_X]|nr:hypothetical protein M902_0655 [Bacteriovorax sp. BAL6_X]
MPKKSQFLTDLGPVAEIVDKVHDATYFIDFNYYTFNPRWAFRS